MAKRILHIIASLDRAGAEKQLRLLACGLSPDKFDVHVCALTRGGPVLDELRRADIPTSVIGKRWKADPVAWHALYQHVRKLRPQLVHTWMFAAGAYGRSAARAAGVPHAIAAERCVDRWKSGYQWRIDRRLARGTDRIVANSTAVRDYCVAHGLPADRFVVIPGAVGPAPSSRIARTTLTRPLGIPEDAKLIGAVGRLWPQKRVKDLIWVAELLSLVRDNVHLLIVGDGPRRRDLERFANQLDARGYVHFLGHRDDVPDLLPHLDLLWLGSGYEGLPNAVMEAMAAAVPVVATDIPGNRDLVVPGETGFLVPVGARAEFTRASNRILDDPDLAKRLGAAGRRRVAESFSVDAMIARYAELYHEILD